jgi:hypothetical protein
MQTSTESAVLELSPSLLRAIEEHKYLRSCATCREIGFLDAARDFVAHHEAQWRAAKLRADNAQQVKEIRDHLWRESQKAGKDVGRTTAATDWVARYAAAWRRHRESLIANGFLRLEVALPAGGGPSGERLESLLRTVSGFFADVFAGQEGIARPHFRLEPEPGAARMSFLVFRSAFRQELDQLAFEAGAPRILFVAYGRDAEQAIATVRAAFP